MIQNIFIAKLWSKEICHYDIFFPVKPLLIFLWQVQKNPKLLSNMITNFQGLLCFSCSDKNNTIFVLFCVTSYSNKARLLFFRTFHLPSVHLVWKWKRRDSVKEPLPINSTTLSTLITHNLCLIYRENVREQEAIFPLRMIKLLNQQITCTCFS